MKTAKVSIQDKYLKTSFTKLPNIFSNLNEISRKIQQLPCKKMHLRFVYKMAVILCGPQYTVKCRYNAVLGVQEIDRVIAVIAL